jgi:soluble lytic murein transglycosylase
VGRADEVGLMQITEGAVKDWRSARGGPLPTRAMCFDPGLNLEVGTWYLARAMRNWRQYRSADLLALTEYNAGRTCAREAAPANPLVEITEAAVRVRSTQNYIAQVRRKWHDLERAQLPRG